MKLHKLFFIGLPLCLSAHANPISWPAESTASTYESTVQTVPYVDLNSYMGLWYEIASIPQSFQKDCVGNTTAEYTMLDNGEVEVYNSCDKNSGERKTATGRAKVTDEASNAKLKVTFVKIIDWVYLFGGDYWIIDLGTDYNYAVVGHPSRKYAWILSRTPTLAPADLKLAYDALVAQKYDTCKVLTSIQNGGFFERRQLCEVVQP